MKNRTVSKEFTVTLESGKVITAEVESVWIHDSSYGADADGNRAIHADFIEDLYLTVPIDDQAWEFDDNGLKLSQSEKEEAEKLLLEKAEHDEWQEANEPEIDYGWED